MKVSDFLDTREINTRQILIVALAVTILVLDSADLSLLSYVSPVMIEEWKVTKGMFGIALSAAFFSMGIGSLLGGWIGDRVGRKKALMFMVLIFGSGSVLTAFVTDITSLTIIRLISGFGFGAATPNALALATEWVPTRARSRVASIIYIGVSGGAALAGVLATFLLAVVGWQGLFIICGIITMVTGLLIWVAAPESPQYLQVKGRLDDATAALKQIFGKKDEALFTSKLTRLEIDEKSVSTKEGILSPAYRRFTIGTCFSFVAQASFFYSLATWLPIILLSFGFTLKASIVSLLILSFIAISGGLIVEPIIRRFGTKSVMLWLIGFNAVMTVIMIGFSIVNRDTMGAISGLLVLVILYATSFAQAALSSSEYILMSHGYPVSSRAAGFGANLMCARFAGMAGISLGGFLLGLREHDTTPYFSMNLVLLALLAISIFVIDRHVRPRKHLERMAAAGAPAE
ncbi:MFS transporter [Bradyrhizobium sp. SYSU BS000235]|uniref:MFS transporter n=1 Tax=Bradyrhizobium sp. SYSU BS000235 TaxID=3411332 RepID=UPI003C72C6BA